MKFYRINATFIVLRSLIYFLYKIDSETSIETSDSAAETNIYSTKNYCTPRELEWKCKYHRRRPLKCGTFARRFGSVKL